MSANIEGMLNEAQRELDAGRNAEAMTLLLRVTEHDERNERAWLLLAQAVDTNEEKRTCLDNVLIINPGNQQAQQMLAELDRAQDNSLLGGDDPFGEAGGFSASDFGGSRASDAQADPFAVDSAFDPPPPSPDSGFGGPFGMDDVDEPPVAPPPVSRAPAAGASGGALGDVYEDERIGDSYDYDYDTDDLDADADYGDEPIGYDTGDVGFEDDNSDDGPDDGDEDFLSMIPEDVRPTRSPGMNEKPNAGLLVGIGILGVLNVLALVALVVQFVG